MFQGNRIAQKGLLNIGAGFALMVAAIYPTQSLLSFFLIPVFLFSSLLSIVYLSYVIAAYRVSHLKAPECELFDGISDLYLTLIALLSALACLFTIDPTYRLFCILLVAVILISIPRTVFEGIILGRTLNRRRLAPKTSAFILFTLVLCVVVTRGIMFFIDGALSYIAFCVAVCLLAVWLSFGIPGFIERRKNREQDELQKQ